LAPFLCPSCGIWLCSLGGVSLVGWSPPFPKLIPPSVKGLKSSHAFIKVALQTYALPVSIQHSVAQCVWFWFFWSAASLQASFVGLPRLRGCSFSVCEGSALPVCLWVSGKQNINKAAAPSACLLSAACASYYTHRYFIITTMLTLRAGWI